MSRLNEPESASPGSERRRLSPRGLAEGLATTLIVAGVIMLMQPFSLTLYTYSFAVTLAGTVLFVVGSKFPA
ncbi:hypothetical protein [Prosthecodimorpha staleyi]|uniref:Uncharacterized protein n=1 Tax=Prosthecodimorpha staleyi TaxID=2840188 RepID=A0A947DCN3_9HYPH|nr:hypothetical protein [Prosthecodimorpha staleyi]MBT9292409.1 hypothetical protein [Prosthecodimorpha staleyi]